MPQQQPSDQSEQAPFITVGLDGRGSVCWLVVTADQLITASSGSSALMILEAVLRSRGLPMP